jgi:two-component system sensor histidine kinase KdpD
MSSDRPNPDELLARLSAEASEHRRGKLKIFFGYAAGVGKTYAMLEAARREKAEGIDVVVGYVELHGRPETEALLQCLEVLPTLSLPYRGVNLREFDLDAGLRRNPQLLLVDELAHTNAEGLRHAKRWQDIEELLAAGIDVYTTLNVQHVESLNDVIAQITGIVVRETLPDNVLERADDIELIDLTPEELMDRLKAGKVYLQQQAERALVNFFQRANLQALRELSLRQAAHRLRRDVEAARQEKAAKVPWATNELLLVCVGPSPTTAKLIRSAKRMATAFGAEWLAVAVETPGTAKSIATRELLGDHMRMAEELGGETHTVVGPDLAATILEYARSRNVTKIVVGKSAQPWWKKLFRGTVVEHLLKSSGDIDVYVITGEGEAPRLPTVSARQQGITWSRYVATLIVMSICGLLGWLSDALHLTEANIAMIFILGVALVAFRFGRGPSIAASVLGVLIFDFFFVPPYFRFAVSDAQYVLTFAIMLVIGIIISTLTSRIKEQLAASRGLERRTSALFRLTRQMTEVTGTDFLIATAGKQLSEIFDAEVVIYARSGSEPVSLRYGSQTSIARHNVNPVVAQWVSDHDSIAGAGTDTLPNATALFVPLTGSQRTLGAVGVRSQDPERFSDPEQRRLLETCASLIALSLERDQSVLEASEAQVRIQAEQMRNSLLSSVSHDLRTPLAVIAGASSSLLGRQHDQCIGDERMLLQTIVEESRRMTRLVDNLLDMTRLESGSLVINKQWHVLEEIVGSAIGRLKHELQQHTVSVDIPVDLPLINVDGVLLEQAFVNLLENAARYTPRGSQIDISARRNDQSTEIVVADNGPGLLAGSEKRIFEKFFRGTVAADSRRGVGLGLAICEAIVRAHGGLISARNRPTGGAEFTIRLPSQETPPQIQLDKTPAESLIA